jgi:hypothetical protein
MQIVKYIGVLKVNAKLMPHELGKYFSIILLSWELVYIQMGPGKSGVGVG